ncbi:hypothetical protein ACQW5G_00670 [Fructilactobacillus sp. Tb1]|uniref:hypothetical protein n=1 Tax=Fructilactobacillus sp. Tb1 TaxID=3422304 RepID=UPI003D2C10D2
MVENKTLIQLNDELKTIDTQMIMYAHKNTRMYQRLVKRKQAIKRKIIKIKQQPFLK